MNNNLTQNFSAQQIIKYPLITDKATRLLENNQYTFIVDLYSSKFAIKSAIESLFDVKIIKINTCHLPKKKKTSRQIYWLEIKSKKSNCNSI